MEFLTQATMFPIRHYAKKYLDDFMCSILKTGPIPQHIAMVMDGNRRYAKQNALELGQGHIAGFKTFTSILQVCSALGVHTVTVYAFSIENFNREPEEQDFLFDMVRNQLSELGKDEQSLARRLGWKIKLLGNRKMLDDEMLRSLEEVEEMTKDNSTMVVNICCPYTSRDDMAQAVKAMIANNKDSTKNITEEDYVRNLYLGDSEPLDILIRTSGATRLSDFMLWECIDDCQIEFVSTMWPDFSTMDLYRIILRWGYQQTAKQKKGVVFLDKLPPAPPAISVSDVRSRV